VADALALLRRERVLPLRALVEAIAGEPVAGSWWGHPRGKEIYNASAALASSPETLVTRYDGRITYVHRSLWPAFARVVTDPEWRAGRIAALPEDAAALLGAIARDGEARNPPRKAREALERRLLVATEEVHEGRHVVVLRPWRLPVETAGTIEDALATLRDAGMDLNRIR
jgi:hypothetical protein